MNNIKIGTFGSFWLLICNVGSEIQGEQFTFSNTSIDIHGFIHFFHPFLCQHLLHIYINCAQFISLLSSLLLGGKRSDIHLFYMHRLVFIVIHENVIQRSSEWRPNTKKIITFEPGVSSPKFKFSNNEPGNKYWKPRHGNKYWKPRHKNKLFCF